MIPKDAKKSEDGRFKATESLLTAIERKKRELDGRRPLTKEFVVEYTYNSNAIEANTLTLKIKKNVEVIDNGKIII